MIDNPILRYQPSSPPKEVYLGDGLYASFDGFQYKLRAPREHGDDVVYLDPETLAEFDKFRRAVTLAAGIANG